MRVLVILIDACGVDYISRGYIPFFKNTLKNINGNLSSSVIRSSPHFAHRVEIMTGNSARHENVFVDYCYIPDCSPFSKLKSVCIHFPPFLRKRPYPVKLLLKYLGKYAMDPINIPLKLLPYFSINPNLLEFFELESSRDPRHMFGIFENAGFNVHSLYGTVGYIEHSLPSLSASKSKDEVVFIHYSELDFLGHKFGPNSLEVKTAAHRISSSIERMISRLDPDYVVIFSDHNMVQIKRNINLWSILQKSKAILGRDYVVFLNSPMARFWFMNDKARKEILTILSKIPHGRILTPTDLRKFNLPQDLHFGELIFWMEKGYGISPDFYSTSSLKGMHGYLDDKMEVPLFIITKDTRVILRDTGKLFDILPTLFDILNIRIPRLIEGNSLVVDYE